jgi:uncharacterized protein (DUF433 family)
MIAAEPLTHIRLDENGVAWIDDANVKVIEIAVEKISRNSTPEQMRAEYPHLTLGQIYAALAYYHDHQEQFDMQIRADRSEIAALREAAGAPPKADELRAAKKRP